MKSLYLDNAGASCMTRYSGAPILFFDDAELLTDCGLLLADMHIESLDLVPKLMDFGALDWIPSKFIAHFDSTLTHREFYWIVNEQTSEKTRRITHLMNNCDHTQLFLATRLESTA